ncbi:predicted protein [Histoplasma mississippiense (nom. inval.)]|uniref:predicted protein n=1 Tax=Ajellomyces capsulatus (strain NAm1 / WU24) TaxID=2059318 RepID=UPI000157B984|nr:predicted protein [Histoplasma mississippiense (nom. inval.)]EDN03353.1 predicted protein [Histoplasma mississippiense (nom. inval.)]
MDFNSPTPLDFIRGKTILLTGGASGFGATFFSRWAAEGATVIIGDINTVAGAELVARVREETQNPNLHFLPLDVTSWQSQVDFFREAVKLSPHGGIDTVVANAGINNAKESKYFEEPPIDYQNDSNPPAPRFSTIDTSYCVSKHGVMGLFRSLRVTTPLRDGVRVNILCPYFTETPILGISGKVILSGAALTDINHVCDAATRFVADPGCVGRSVVIAPKLRVRSPLSGLAPDGESEGGEERIPGMGGLKGIPDMQDVYDLATNPTNSGLRAESKAGGDGREVRDIAIWEFYTHDLDDSELFTRRIVGILLITARKDNVCLPLVGDQLF